MYSDLYLQKGPKIPTHIVGIVLMLVAGISVYFFMNSTSAPTRASKISLVQHETVNVSSKQIGVFWKVEKPDKGWVIYGTNAEKLSETILDERDVTDKNALHQYHFVMLKNLKPDSQYFYKIVSNNELLGKPDGQPFSVRTPRDVLPGSAVKPAYGKIVEANNQPAQNAFVILRYKNAYPLVALTGPTGEWLIPLQGFLNKQDVQPPILKDQDTLNIQVVNESGSSDIQALVSKTNPLPQTVVIGTNYRFLDENQVLPAFDRREQAPPARADSSSSTSSSNQPSPNPPSASQRSTSAYPVGIRYPESNAIIPGSQPLIRGVGVPGKSVVININSKPLFSTKVQVNQSGDWRASVPGVLSAGAYTLTVTTEDSAGKKVGERRVFTIAKSGEQVLGDATGSATLTPTRYVTQVITSNPTPRIITATTKPPITSQLSPVATQSATISAMISPTIFPTLIPTATGSGILYGTITQVPQPPASGISMVPLVFIGFGLMVASATFILLF